MKKIKWFWIWQDEKEEAWLSEMAQKGYQLESVGFVCMYSFKESKPSNIVYKLDYFDKQKQSVEEYLKPLLVDGWKFIGEKGGWQYFRKIFKDGTVPEITQNNKGKAEKYQHVMMFLVGFLPIMLLWFPFIDNKLSSPLFEILRVVFVVLLVIFTISTYKIYRRISQLRDL